MNSIEYKCPHCGFRYSPDYEKDYDGLVPYHDWPVPCRQVCPGSKQNPRDVNDKRPLWQDEKQT